MSVDDINHLAEMCGGPILELAFPGGFFQSSLAGGGKDDDMPFKRCE